MNIQSEKISDGLYYGQNKGFFPQPIVYVDIKGDTAYATGFYPLKGELFATFTDTLYYSMKENVFSSEKSFIYIKNKKFYFKRTDELLVYRVAETRIIYAPEKEDDFIEMKNQSKSL